MPLVEVYFELFVKFVFTGNLYDLFVNYEDHC
jgi:hypothetical protein